MTTEIRESFGTATLTLQGELDPVIWQISDYANVLNFIDTSYRPSNVAIDPNAQLDANDQTGGLVLTLDTNDDRGKDFTGGEIFTSAFYKYGAFETTMIASAEAGTASTFFGYTGENLGSPRSEIDFEILGSDPTQVVLTYHSESGFSAVTVPLGFDASQGAHTYRFEWGPESIEWYVDDVLLRSVTAATAPVPLPEYAMRMYASLWTGDSEAFTGIPTFTGSTTATYYDLNYTPWTGPLVADDMASSPVNGSVSIDVLANDSDYDDGLSGAVIDIKTPAGQIPGTAVVDVNTNEIVFTPTAGSITTATFAYTITVGGEESPEATVTVTIGDPVADGAALLTTADDDVVFGRSGDFVDGLAGNDILRGESGEDELWGNIGDDQLFGGANRDILVGGSGNDWLEGGKALDTFRIVSMDGFDTIADFKAQGGEILDISAVIPTYNPLTDSIADFARFTRVGNDAILAIDVDGGAGPAGFVDVARLIGARNLDAATLESAGQLITFVGVPASADDDGDLAIQGPSGALTTLNADMAELTLSGLDVDATAVVTVTDSLGGTVVSGVLSADGPVQLDLSTLQPGVLTATVEASDGAVTAAGAQSNFALIQVSAADLDANLAVLPLSDFVDVNDAAAVGFQVNGLDANTTAVVSLDVGGLTPSSNDITADGGVATFDLRAADLGGAPSATVNATVVATVDANQPEAGATAQATNMTLTLVAPTADDDGDLAITPTDTVISAEEMSAVTLTLAGLDSDASATMQLLDANGFVVAQQTNVTADGDLIFDLSSAADGLLTTRIIATDIHASQTTVTTADALRIAATAPTFDFSTGAGAFAYQDDTFRGSAQPTYASGAYSATDQALKIELGGVNGSTINDISGGFVGSFDTTVAGDVTLRIDFQMIAAGVFEPDEISYALIEVDGVEYELARLLPTSANDEILDTGAQQIEITIPNLSIGAHTLKVGAFVEGKSSSDEIVTMLVSAIDVDQPTPSAADANGDLAISTPDLLLDVNDAGVVVYTVTGIDANTTAQVDLTIGTTTLNAAVVSTGPNTGDATFDLSNLALLGGADSQNVAAIVTVTVDAGQPEAGATAQAIAAPLTLVAPTADDDGDLSITAPDPTISAAEAANVILTLSGLDSDATATVQLLDANDAVVRSQSNITANGDLTFDLTGLPDGPLSAKVIATDAWNTVTEATTPDALTVALTAPTFDFTGGLGTFAYQDDAFRGTAQPTYATGDYSQPDQALRLELGGVNKNDVDDISGGFVGSFTTDTPGDVTLRVDFQMTAAGVFEANERSFALLEVNGVEHQMALLSPTASDDEVLDTGPQQYFVTLTNLPAGVHSIKVGGYIEGKTSANEITTMLISGVNVAAPVASPADLDGDLSIATTDTLLDVNDAGVVVYSVTGLDLNTTGVVELSINGSTLTQTVTRDSPTAETGSATFDLSDVNRLGGLDSAVVTATVTATVDVGQPDAGATAQSSDAALTLVAPTADDDGDLAVTAPDERISAGEVASVVLTVAGLDGDATATVQILDSNAVVLREQTGVNANGDLTFDLTGVPDGPLSAKIIATDVHGATAEVTNTDALTLATSAPTIDFTDSIGSFVYQDDAFRSTVQPNYADGFYSPSDFGLKLELGGVDKREISEISGGFAGVFTTSVAGDVTLRIDFQMIAAGVFESNEVSYALVAVNGVEYEMARLVPTNANDEVLDTGAQQYFLTLTNLAAGTHNIKVGAFLDDKTSVDEVVTMVITGIDVDEPAQSPADVDNNLSISTADAALDVNDADVVVYTVTGLDLNTTGEVELSINGSTLTQTVTRNSPTSETGTVTFDLSDVNRLGGLDSIVVTATVTATVDVGQPDAGATAQASDANFTLLAPSADDDGDLAVTAPDATISAGEEGAVILTVAGLDADATATVQILDANDVVVAQQTNVAADGDVTFNLTSVADGRLTTRIIATDANGATTEITNADALTLATSAPSFDFTGGAGGFTYQDDAFRGTTEPTYALGFYSAADQALRVEVGGVDDRQVGDMSGAFAGTFTTTVSGDVTLRVDFRMTAEGVLEQGEDAFALLEVNGTEYEMARLTPTNANDEVLDTGFQQYLVTIPNLAAGAHTIKVGGFLDAKTSASEFLTMLISGVDVDEPSSSPADIDGNLTVSTTDALLDVNDAQTVTYTVSGIDPNTTAEVELTIGSTTLTQTVLSPTGGVGTVTFDLSDVGRLGGAPSAQVTAVVTATVDAGQPDAGATAQSTDASLTLVAPTADDDGDLSLTAADQLITASELTTVALTLSGLDADATATVQILDQNDVVLLQQTGVSGDGDVIFDITSLADGALKTRVIATDANLASTTLDGDAITKSAAPPSTSFETGPDGFVYFDDAFRGTLQPAYADGVHSVQDQALVLTLGGVDNATTTGMSGGFQTTFENAPGQGALITVDFDLDAAGVFEDNEITEAIITIDGTEYVMATITPTNANDEVLTVSNPSFQVRLPVLASGPHTVVIGAHLTGKTSSSEFSTLKINAFDVTLFVPSPADIEGDLDLSAPTLLYDGNELAQADFVISGLDANTTAVIEVTDINNTTFTSSAIAQNGAVQLDLTSANLAVGPLTTTVTATVSSGPDQGVSIAVDGPTLTNIAPTADNDGDLTLDAPDLFIRSNEADAVALTVTGLDANATAVASVTDGAITRTATFNADGVQTVDLTGMAAGAITTSLVATDAFGATANAVGPTLTYDTSPILDFSAETAGLRINLETREYAEATRISVIGDSLSVGVVDRNQPYNYDELDGWRNDVQAELLDAGAFIDFVGAYQSGGARTLDPDHSAEGGIQLAEILDGRAPNSAVAFNVNTYSPDIMLFYLGTNDYRVNNFFSSRMERIIDDTEVAILEFFANADPSAYFVLSTQAPKTPSGDPLEPELAGFLNKGYSIVNGDYVEGDAGNGSYVPGLEAMVANLQLTYSNLLVFDNPITVSDLSPDNLHFSEAGYTKYGNAMADFLEANIGIADGTLDTETGQTLGAGAVVIGGSGGDFITGDSASNELRGGGGNDVIRGGSAGDQILGDAGNDRLDGDAGADILTGGAGTDAFVFDANFATAGETDQITDFGDGADYLVLDSVLNGSVTVADGANGGVVLSFAGRGDIEVAGANAQNLKGVSQGGGVFDLTTDTTYVVFVTDTDNLLV